MAKVAYSALVAGIRNKVGNNVFTKGRFGPVVRIRVSPTQPRTAAQTAVRGNFTTNSKAWDTITQAQRNGWIALAASSPQHDVFGNTYYMTGLQMYQFCNRNLQTIGVAPISAAPAALSIGAPGALTLVATAGTPVLTVDAATEPAAAEVPVIYAVKPLNAGRIFIGNQARVLDTSIAAATAGPWDIKTLYTAKYGALVVGQNINVEVAYVHNTTGAASGRSSGQIFVAA